MPGGSWAVPTFIDSEDNREAVSLARDLTTHRKALQHRVDDSQARRALELGGGTPRRCKPCTEPESWPCPTRSTFSRSSRRRWAGRSCERTRPRASRSEPGACFGAWASALVSTWSCVGSRPPSRLGWTNAEAHKGNLVGTARFLLDTLPSRLTLLATTAPPR